jgi:hypothetical protein
MSLAVQVFGRRNAETIHALLRRRPQSAKAGNRGWWDTDNSGHYVDLAAA